MKGPNRTNPIGYKCDWCGMSYPLGGWDYDEKSN